ncbi:MAG: glycosyltransferase [Ruminococcus sp.]|nr:glycosyltransferase [Ruminococcus sp.]
MKEKISKLINVYKKNGFLGFCRKLKNYIKANYLDKISFKVFINKNKYRKQIKDILINNKYERIIVWRSSFGYNVPLFQRPQHICNNFSKQNCLVFYEVTSVTDNIKTLQEYSTNLYLFNFNNKILNKILMQELKNISKPKYLDIFSTDWKLSLNDLEYYKQNNFKLIYEYIDHLSPEIAGTKELPQYIIDKYNYAMENKDAIVVVTADLLKEDVIKKRGNKNLVFSTNGVDYNFFKNFDEYTLDKDFQDILNKKKKIVMYYGSLASWVDYDLLKKIAKTDKYSIVLFGIKYDTSYDEAIKKEKNIYFLGSRPYHVLKYYAKEADVLTIPFLLNDVTASTSPVKIFEYMALNKPIVTTNLKECRKYKSVLIAKTHEEFLEKLEETEKLSQDKKYLELLDKEAKENDWSHKAEAIIKVLKEIEK